VKLTCKKCRTEIEIPPEATRSPDGRVVCPGCGARYRLKPRTPQQGTESPPGSTLTPSRTSAEAPSAAGGGGEAGAGVHADGSDSGSAFRTFQPGEVIAERYRIARFLAQGGMGEVYEAEDLELRQKVALKTIAANAGSGSTDGSTLDRFRREIALARTVTHPNVCRIFDLGQHRPVPRPGRPAPPKVLFLTMELLEGETLADRLRRAGRFDPEEAFPLVRQMAAALGAAHDARVVHRDFKSENVFLVPIGDDVRAVVTDFGVARGAAGNDAFATRMTGAGIVGTPAYMAPEQVEGREVTPAADVYALGVVLYEMMTGELPFSGKGPLATAVSRLKEPPPPPTRHRPDLPPHWERAILQCLERHVEKRFSSVGQVVSALAVRPGSHPTGTPTTAHPLSAAPPPPTAAPPSAPPADQPGSSLPEPSPVEPTPLESAQAPPPPTSSGTGAEAEPAGEDEEPAAEVDPAAALRATLVPPAPPKARRRRRLLAAALVVVAAVSAGLYLYNLLAGEGRRAGPRRSVAVLGFKNLTERRDFAWVSTAVSEMLTTELARGGALRTVPGSRVAEVRNELELEEGADLPAELRSQLRSLLGADYLVYGSYTGVGAGGEGRIRLDLRLQDAALGENLASLSASGAEEEIFTLVTDLGRELRAELGVGGDGEDPMAGLPTEPEAARLYAQALEDLRASQPLEARRKLQRAATLEPQNPLIHSALSSAWEAEGYQQRAVESAERAFELSAHLPREDRLGVEGQYRQLRGEYLEAAEIYRNLHQHFPDDLEYGLRLAAMENAANRPQMALRTVEELRLLPAPLAEDPRLDLAAAAAAARMARFEEQLRAATRAAERAQALGSTLLTAQARLAQSQAHRFLGQLDEAERTATDARDLYAQIENPVGRALALTTLANALVDRGELDRAARHDREAAEIYRTIGDQGGLASALNNLALALRKKGDLDRAQPLYEEAAEIYRNTENRLGTANTLNNLGVLLVGRGRLAEAREKFEAARAIWEENGEPNSIAYGIHNVGAVLRLEGELWQSRTLIERALEMRREIGQKIGEVASLNTLGALLGDLGELEEAVRAILGAQTLAQEIGDRSAVAEAFFNLGEVRLDQGLLLEARAAHEEGLELRSELGEVRKVTESRIALARVALAEGDPEAAEELAVNAARACRSRGQSSLEALAQAYVARARLDRGDRTGARNAVAEALPLAEGSERMAVRLRVEMISGRVAAANGQPAQALERLREIETEAEVAGHAGLRLEAMLAAGEILRNAGRAETAREKLNNAQAEATARGYGLLVERANGLLEGLL